MGKNVSMKVILFVLLLIVVLFVFYRYALSPQLARLRDLNDQVAQAEAKLSELREVQRLHDAFVRQNEDYTAWIAKLAEITPVTFDQHTHTQFLLDLQAVGKAAGITYTGIQISDQSMGRGAAAEKPVEINLAKVVGVTMNFTAKDYWTVRRFEDMLRNKFKYLVVKSELSVSRSAATGGAAQVNPYTCSMTAWMVLSPDAAVLTAPTAQ